MERIDEFLRKHRITEIEAIIPDMAGTARGKIIPRSKFESGESMRLPQAVMIQTVTGDYPDDASFTGLTDPDMVCVPDPSTIRLIPWAVDPTAQVIHDCVHFDGTPVAISPRRVLRQVLEKYEAKGWRPVVAPELEFFLVDVNRDPDLPLQPPVGRTGRAETGRQAYSIDAVNEFDPLFEDIYAYCEVQELEVDTLIHEVGAAQMEINFLHGDALNLADRVFLFKRTVREAALRHKMYATFMAKPMESEPGSAMHVHQSIVEEESGRNLFTGRANEPTGLFTAISRGFRNTRPRSCRYSRRISIPIEGFRASWRRRSTCNGAMTIARSVSRAACSAAGTAHREPHTRRRLQSLSGDSRDPRRRLSRHDAASRTHRAARKRRLPHALSVAAQSRRRPHLDGRLRTACGHAWRDIPARLSGAQGNGI